MNIFILSIIIFLLSFTQVFAESYHMHTVQSGETYYKIAKLYQTTSKTLEELNYQSSDKLIPGNLIKLHKIKDIKINVNGNNIEFDQAPYIENESVFVPIRFVAEELNADNIDWNQDTKTATIYYNNKIISVTVGSDIVNVDGQATKIDAPVQLYINRTFVPIRFFSEIFEVSKIDWEADSYIVIIEKNETESVEIVENVIETEKNYSEEDLYWLSRIVHSEAQAESYEGKLGVANTIINRKISPSFPNTIKGVIFDTKYSVQYTPTVNGKIYETPNEDSVKASTEALEGNNNVGDSLYFINPKKSPGSWVEVNRTFYITIDNHCFYL